MFDFDFDKFPDSDNATIYDSKKPITYDSKRPTTYSSTVDGIKNTEEEEERVRELEAAVAGMQFYSMVKYGIISLQISKFFTHNNNRRRKHI
jgi:hypothetical protein